METGLRAGTLIEESVSLSLISKRSKRLVRTTKTSLTGFNIKFYKDVTEVQFITSEKKEVRNWFFKIEEKESSGGQVMEMSFKDDVIHSYHSAMDIQQSVKLGVEYLRDLFAKPILEVFLFPDDIPYPFYIGFKECNNLYMKGEKPMRNEDLKNVLENVLIKSVCIIQLPVNADFKCNNNALKFNEFSSLSNACGHWITREVLLSLKCSRIHLHHTLLEAHDFMAFFERWYYSNDKHFEVMILRTDKTFNGLRLDGFHQIPWDTQLRGQHFLYAHKLAFDCSEGTNIMREDGILCTVLFRETIVFFCVWHNRFPDISGATIFI
ncbi:hypothetical protein CRE_25891 [Caenorhabditis remanei]|uniref:F-box associated domain-containing protein n=1 Tax=Caenorhabditis remanei TaxID=31234 RepID=E3NGF5_CAERE|nr:hypothetical protein CRE_25891 [Caenorhabditis remanei]